MPRVSAQGLRRTFEDLLREAGVEQLVRRAVAGWRSEKAQGIYATVRREDRDAAADAVLKLVLPDAECNLTVEKKVHPKGTPAQKRENARSTQSANRASGLEKNGAGHEIRTRDFNLGKVALYH